MLFVLYTAVTGLPGVTFSEREIRVLENAENADEPPVACIILYGGGLGGQPASFDITSFPGSATGSYIHYIHI